MLPIYISAAEVLNAMIKNNVLILLLGVCTNTLFSAVPVHEWLFNEGNGVTVADTGTGAKDGTLMDGTTSAVHGPRWVIDPVRGCVLEFDGTDWILTNSQGILGSNPRTVTAWIYLLADLNRHTIIQWGNGNGNCSGQYFRLLIENRRLRFEVASGNALALNEGALELNRWYHIALAVDDFNKDGAVRTPEVKFYLNGQNVAQTQSTSQIINTTFTDSNCYVRLGGAAQCSGSSIPREAMKGRLDDIRIYNYALSASEIQQEMMSSEIAWAPIPANNSMVPVSTASLSWQPGKYAQTHQVYFGTNQTDVSTATPADPRGVYLASAQINGPNTNGRYEIVLADEGLSLVGNTSYYWRVDEVNSSNPASPWKGNIWKFTTNTLDTVPKNLVYTGDLSLLIFKWEPPLDIQQPRYNVLLASDPNFQQIVSRATGLDSALWQADTSAMVYEKQYYCRVEAYEANDPAVRGFSDRIALIFNAPRNIENFDQYQQDSELLAAWQDGSSNSTGSRIILCYEANGQSMKLAYKNNISPYFSEVQYTYPSVQNWLSGGTRILQLSFRGMPANSPAALYVKLADEQNHSAKVYYPGGSGYIVQPQWSPWTLWRINLNEFTSQEVNISRIRSFLIGVENSPAQPGNGEIYIDSICLDIPRCPASQTIPADLNRDCISDMKDLILLAGNWMATSYWASAASSEPDGLLASYSFDETEGTVVHDNSDNLFHADLISPNPTAAWDAGGIHNGCINLTGASSVLLPAGVFNSIDSAFTISFWIYFETEDQRQDSCIEFIISNGSSYSTSADRVIYSYRELSAGWHHLCVTKDKASPIARIYLDGVIAGENQSALTDMSGSSIGISRLGADWTANFGFSHGKIDEFRLYSRALSQSEIVYLYEGPSGHVLQPLVPIISSFDPVQDNKIDLNDFLQIASCWLLENLQ